jgi:CHAT domain-containing protein
LKVSDVAVWRKLTIGSARGYLFQFDDAESSLDEAQALASKYHPELLGQVALRKGTVSLLHGDVQDAQSFYRVALKTAQAQNDPFLETAALGSLGLVATQQEHYDESVQLNREALQLSQSIGAQGSSANILGNMAWGFFELGDYGRSLGLFQQAEDSAAKKGNLGAELRWKVDVGTLDFYLRDYGTAQSDLREALDLAKKLDERSQVGASLDALASVALAEGQPDTAEIYSQRALDQFRSIGDHDDEISSELTESRIETEKQHASDAEKILTAILNDSHSKPSTLWEAHARLATVYASEQKNSDAQKQFRRAISTVQTARGSVQDEELRLSFLSNAIEFYDDYVEFLVSQHRTDEALGIATLTRAQTLIEGLRLRPPKAGWMSADWSSAAARDHATILTYWLGTHHSYLWAIPPSGHAHFFTLPPQGEIDPIAKSYAEAVLGPRDPLSASNEDGARLFEILVKPALKLIPKGSRVVIVPDGSLFGLNFETLPVESPSPHYWIDDVTVINASSPVLVAEGLPAKPSAHGKLLLIGDPIPPDPDFPALPHAATEIGDIERHFPQDDTTVVTGKNATPEAYLDSQPAKFSYIHFAAHGTSSETTPLESAVILSRQGESFKLYGRDVVKLPLRGALVTISACQGIGSRNYSGEGLVGLSWAFLRAGARAVIAALWEVDDASTATLMDHLYEQLSRGVAPAEALRNAKLMLLHSGTVYEKPFYWGPFQYYAGA